MKYRLLTRKGIKERIKYCLRDIVLELIEEDKQGKILKELIPDKWENKV